MKRSLFASLVLITLIGSVVSCGPASSPSGGIVATASSEKSPTAVQPATPVATPTVAPTETPANTPTPTPTATPVVTTKQAEYENVSFVYDRAIAQDANGQTIPESSGPDAPYWEIAPKHVRFRFDGYAVPNGAPEAAIYVFLVEQYKAISPDVANPRIDVLRDFLTQKPDLKEIYPTYESLGVPSNPEGAYQQYRSFFPLLPPANAARLVTLKMEYLDFGSGSGIRYVTQFAQGLEPIAVDKIFYAFQGLTADGKYYVSAVFPLKAGIVTAASPDPTDLEALNSYNEMLAESLEKAGSGGFSPDLTTLDNAVKSIAVR